MAGTDDNKIVVAIELDDGSVRQGFIRVQEQGESAFKKIGETAAGVFAGEALLRGFEKLFDGAKELFGEMIKSATQSEQAIQGLNTALGVSGRYSSEASSQFQELAEKIQATTAVSDDTVLGLERLAITYSKTNAQALKLTETSVNLAAVTGQDANTALQQLAGTLSGQAGRLQKLFPELQNFTTAQLKAGAAVEFFNSRFAGAAASQVNTFGGRMAQLTNAFDDFLKSVGKLITGSPAVIAVIKFIGEQFSQLAGYFKQFQGQDLFKGPILALIEFSKSVNYYLVAPLELGYNIARTVFDGIKTLIQGQITLYATAASKIVGFFAPNSELAQGLKTFSESSAEVLGQFAQDTKESFLSINSDTKITDGFDAILSKMRDTVAAAQPVKDTFAQLGSGARDTSGAISSLGQTFQLLKDGAVEALGQLNDTGQKVFRELGGSTIKAFASGVAQGMAAIGKALVKGQDIFAAFAGAMLSALGQAAIQMGSTYILLGLARLFTSYGADPTAGQLIGVGSALAVAGGALVAVGEGVSGKGGDSSASSSDTGSGNSSFSSAVTATGDISGNPAESVKAQDTGPQVVVHIQGDVLDSTESGLRIVELINNEFNRSGARVQS